MTERTRSDRRVTLLRVGGNTVGAATLLLDDDSLTFVPEHDDDPPVRLRSAQVDRIHQEGERLELALRDGTLVTMIAAPGLGAEVFARCRALPELTRTLRAFGSSRGRRSARLQEFDDHGAQHRFFAPLLDARRAGAAMHGIDAVAAFDATALRAEVERVLANFAGEREPAPGPARRALEAHLADAAEPLLDAIEVLRTLAEEVAAASEDLTVWRAWAGQLRQTFETADRVWVAVDGVLHQARPAGGVRQ